MPKNRTNKTAALRAVQRQVKSPFGVPYTRLRKLDSHMSPDERQQVVKNMAVSDAWRSMSRRQRKRVLTAMKEPTAKAPPRKARLTTVKLKVFTHDKTCSLYAGAKICNCNPEIKQRSTRVQSGKFSLE